VIKHAWAADESDGMVPRSLLFTSNNRVDGPFVDAREIFAQMTGMIESAKHEVDLETDARSPAKFELDAATIGDEARAMIDDPASEAISAVDDPTALLLGALVVLERKLRAAEEAGQAPELPVTVRIALDGVESSLASAGLGSPALFRTRLLHNQLASIDLDPKYVDVHVGAYERKIGSLHSKMPAAT
jgi:hypothetical protein